MSDANPVTDLSVLSGQTPSRQDQLPSLPLEETRHGRWIACALIGLTFLCYWRVLGADFVNYDDQRYITNNIEVQKGLTGASIQYALTSAKAGDVVLIAGKGHETYQEGATGKRPFDDLAVARHVLEART